MRIEKKKQEQLRTFKKNTDKGLPYLINEAYRILGNPIILYDADFKILAYTEGVITDDPIWNNHINDGGVNKNIDIFANEGFLDIIMVPDKVVLLKSEKVKYDRIFGKIFDKGNNILAGVSVVASNKPFEDDDFMATEAICKMLSNEILKIPYYHNYAQNKLETCINMLIDKEIEALEDRLYVSGYVEMVYKDLKYNLYLAVADISQCDPTYAKLDYYKNLFKQTRPAFKYSIYSVYIVILMSTDEPIFYPKRNFIRLNRLFEKDNIKVGISSRFENLFELPRYYNEAVKALNNGLKHDSGQWIFVYDDEDFLPIDDMDVAICSRQPKTSPKAVL